jgi:hypothetical protein
VNPRRSLNLLRAEGLTIPQIAGIGRCSTSSVRRFMAGDEIPNGAAVRFWIAARTFRALGLAPLSPHATFADLVARHSG